MIGLTPDDGGDSRVWNRHCCCLYHNLCGVNWMVIPDDNHFVVHQDMLNTSPVFGIRGDLMYSFLCDFIPIPCTKMCAMVIQFWFAKVDAHDYRWWLDKHQYQGLDKPDIRCLGMSAHRSYYSINSYSSASFFGEATRDSAHTTSDRCWKFQNR